LKLAGLEYPRRNPYLRDRFNAMNAAFCNARGERRLFVNAAKCPELVADLLRVTYPYEDYKRKNPKRTHASDAAGYMVVRRMPVGREIATVRVR